MRVHRQEDTYTFDTVRALKGQHTNILWLGRQCYFSPFKAGQPSPYAIRHDTWWMKLFPQWPSKGRLLYTDGVSRQCSRSLTSNAVARSSAAAASAAADSVPSDPTEGEPPQCPGRMMNMDWLNHCKMQIERRSDHSKIKRRLGLSKCRCRGLPGWKPTSGFG